jgi:cyclohexadieny/prephenate dehydrogenase
MKIHTLAIIGVGLIGGSIALAARRRGLAERILGVGRRPETLRRARGIVDDATGDLVAAARQADLAVFCTPVDRIAEQVMAAAPACRPATLLVDAGSTKARIVQALDGHLPAGVDFVGCHPLAGSEKRGWEHAEADLFQDRLTILTPTARTPARALERAASFWKALGSRVHMLNPEKHDEALALTSHLPHLTAAALARLLPVELAGLTATGFRDTTRVASGDPALWTAIFEQNQTAMLAALGKLQENLGELRKMLDQGDWPALQQSLIQAKRVRDALGN